MNRGTLFAVTSLSDFNTWIRGNVQEILAGFLIITERQYGFGDLLRISNLGTTTGAPGAAEPSTAR